MAMIVDIKTISEFFTDEKIEINKDKLIERYYSPIFNKDNSVPECAFYPTTTEEISSLVKYFRTIQSINVVIISSQTKPKFLDDTTCSENTVILDLSNMKEIPFIDKRNKVCVIEPGITWEELVPNLKQHGLRPLIPFLPRPGKSALASVLDREPHMIAKKQFDISDPLLCMELVFGNGEIFRTGEAAGPLSIEENRKAGAALTNPLGPGQTDIFRIIQGSKGSFGCVSWISMQCDLIPQQRAFNVIDHDSLEPLFDFIYSSVRKRLIDEVFILNREYLASIIPDLDESPKEFILIYTINGYDVLPGEKIEYQTADVSDILTELTLDINASLSEAISKPIIDIIDGKIKEKHPKIVNGNYSFDLICTSTLNRVDNIYKKVNEIRNKHDISSDAFYVYIQPVIQARAANIEFSFIVNSMQLDSEAFPTKEIEDLCNECAEAIRDNGGFFSRSYRLINKFAFTDKNLVVQESLKKLKRIFDPDNILNKGQLIF